MLKFRKIIALSLVAMAAIVCFAKYSTKAPEMMCYNSNVKSSSGAGINEANNFSIVNMLSLKFR